MTRPDLPRRPTVRIILADDQDRILLFRFEDANSDVPGGVWWTTPGGGVIEGESLPQAASRELFEETGLQIPPTTFTQIVAHSEGAARYRGRDDWYEHHFYFHRLARTRPTPAPTPTPTPFELDESHWEAAERSTIAGHRWWPAADLATTPETIYPPGLARILPDLLAGRLPTTPIDINHP